MRVPHRPTAPVQEMGGGDSLFGIRAELLIPGRGDPIKDAALVVEDDKIQWVGAHADLPSKYSGASFSKVSGTILPGLWDVHTHFFGANVLGGLQDSFKSFLPGHDVAIGAVTVEDLRVTLMAGFTSVRELGGFAGNLQKLIDSGFIVGPTVYSAYSILSITGGHGDQHDVPLSTVLQAGGGMSAICDGVDDCTKKVRENIRRGAKVIKICSTGGVLSLDDQPEDSQFSPAELEAIVQEAKRSSRVVASHAIGKDGIMAALNAGVKSIEHGMYLDKEVADLMKEKDAILVPTRQIVESLAADPSELPPPIFKKMRRMLELSREGYKFAIKEGVKIALGTDTYSSDRKNACSHGKNAREIHWMTVAGMSPLAAIEASTAIPPETLGPQAPKAGQLKAGYDADFIVVSSNPLDDIEVLTDSKNITHVWKGGKLFKSP